MPTVSVDGIQTAYEVRGSGPPLLMMAPGGFDSTIEKWSTTGLWKDMLPLETLSGQYTCIAYDRRESGNSGGKVERVSWGSYADQAKGLLDALDIPKAFILGACMGVSVALATAVAYPESVAGLVLRFPVGGARWHLDNIAGFNAHSAQVRKNGLQATVELAREKPNFMLSKESGPWASVIAKDTVFAKEYAEQDMDRYLALVGTMGRTLFDRDSVPGVETEELMALKTPSLVIPGWDEYHTQSAARFVQECLPNVEYWDATLEQQTASASLERILSFLNLQHV